MSPYWLFCSRLKRLSTACTESSICFLRSRFTVFLSKIDSHEDNSENIIIRIAQENNNVNFATLYSSFIYLMAIDMHRS